MSRDAVSAGTLSIQPDITASNALRRSIMVNI